MSNKRIQELDGLRGIAAIFVVLYHFTNRFEEKFNLDIFPSFINFEYGHYGVQLFFIISGFVIFMSIKRKEEIQSPKEFLTKRFIRLYPTFWTSLIFTFLIVSLIGPFTLKSSFLEFIVNFTMFPRLFNYDYVDGVYWTLSVELVFYLFILFLLTIKQTNNYIIFSTVYIIIGFMLYFKFSLFSYYLHGLLFLIGMNFYKIWMKESTYKNHLLIFFSLLLYVLTFKNELIIVVSILILVFYLLVNNCLGFLNNKFFVFLGTISYSLYLIHQNVGHSIELKLIEYGFTNYWIVLFIPLIIILLLSYVITFKIEKPIIKYLSKKLTNV